MKEDDVESLGEIDILILPIGGNSVLTAKDAEKIINEIEPKIVIPSHYSIEGLKLPYDKIEVFLKETGAKAETMDKLLVKKKDLNPEVIKKIVILDPLR